MTLVTHTSGTIGSKEICKLRGDEVIAWAESIHVEVKREWDGPEPTRGEKAFFMEVDLEAKGGDTYRVLFCNAQNVAGNLRKRIWGFLYAGESPETCLLRFKPTKKDVLLPDSAIKFTLSRNPKGILYLHPLTSKNLSAMLCILLSYICTQMATTRFS